MFGIADDSAFTDFENNELQNLSPGKELTDEQYKYVYISSRIRMPKKTHARLSPAILGSAVMGDGVHSEDIQPNIRASKRSSNSHSHIALIYGT